MRSGVLLLGLGLLVFPLLAARDAAADAKADVCIKFHGEARYGGLGYNHLVHITNSCAVAADCTVSTDVNPQAQEAEVAAKSEIVVSTFLGSPARTFTPSVKCTMRQP
jgi:hypothetical protein